jgi:hypothetical protein
MNLHSMGSYMGSRCFTPARAWGFVALVGAACNSLDEPQSSRAAAPSSTPSSPGAAAGSPSAGAPQPESATAPSAPASNQANGASPAGTTPDGSGAAAANEAQEVSALDPPVGQDEAVDGAAAESPADPAEGEEVAAPEEIDPESDENLRFILEDGFETTYFAVHCSAIGEDGTEIDGDSVTELPVGGGFILECILDRLPSRSATDVLSAADEPWCALGELRSFATGGDERLGIVLVSAPDSPSPTLIATREGDPITLQLASAFGAPLWPVWLVTSYDVVEVARAEQGKICDAVFEL